MPSQTTQLQRYLSTEFITKRRLNIPAVWLKPEGLTPSVEDAVADSVSTDLGAWDEQNLGVRLVDGHVELRLDHSRRRLGPPAYLRLSDSSRSTLARPTACTTSPQFSIRIDDEIDRWTHRWPNGHTDKQGRKVKTEISLFGRRHQDRSKAIYRVRAAPGLADRRRDSVLAPLGQAAGRHHRTRPRGSRAPRARCDKYGIHLSRHRLRHAPLLDRGQS